MALRMTPGLMQALERLHRAGVAGAGEITLAGADLLVQHGLAERFEDPSLMLDIRVRLTKIGERFAEFFFPRSHIS